MLNRFKYGEWRVNGVGFNSSYEAYLFASEKNSNVNFFYNHESYNNFDISLALQSLVRFLALSFVDSFTTESDHNIKFDVQKYLTESISEDDSNYHFDVTKPLSDT